MFTYKVNPNDWTSITVSDNPEIIGNNKFEDFEDIKKFIILNENIIIQYWNYEISTEDLLRNIKSI